MTIGGFSVLDCANIPNISSTFVIYKDWKERGSALNQDVIIGNINRQLAGLQEAQALYSHSAPHSGLGQTGGFQMMVEDRGNLGLQELSAGYLRTHTGGKFSTRSAKSDNAI